MKLYLTLVGACAILFSAAATAPAHGGELVHVPSVDAFFDAMAIDIAPGRQARYVSGDNHDGYFSGLTQGTGNGEGYVTRAGTQLLDYSSRYDGQLNEREGATEQVLPWGHRLHYSNGAREEMALLSGRHAVAMDVRSDRPGMLAIAPLLRAPGAISRIGNAVLVTPAPGDSVFVALRADIPFRLDPGLVLRAETSATSFTVIAAVGESAEEALARAAAINAASAIDEEKAARHRQLTRSYLATSDAHYNRALNWARASAASFVVDEFGAGIWAGLPWFRDNWGRDTFIALPGTLLVAGQFEQAKAVLVNFARYQNLAGPRDQEYGRIPNRVSKLAPTIYNTVDGTPWMLREALETIRYTGDRTLAARMLALAVPYFDGAMANYVGADGLLAHDSADTWMDARIDNREPWSARGPRAVEIQALWYTALQTGAELARMEGDHAHARQWSALADKVQRHFLAAFWDGAVMADRLREDGSRDVKTRPNQLMLLSIPLDGAARNFVPAPVQAKVLRNAASTLLYPYGITSLADTDPYFHPRHENPTWHHKDAAYHQGTIWGWNAGFTVSALTRFGYQDHAWALTDNLGRQILGENVALPTLGAMSELLDALPLADGSLKASGTYAQSWSVAEYARNAYQDYLGFRPDLIANTLYFAPALPRAWTSLEARLPFGEEAANASLDVAISQTGAASRWQFKLHDAAARRLTLDLLDTRYRRQRVTFMLRAGASTTLVSDGRRITLNGRPLRARVVQASYDAVIGKLTFRTPPPYVPANFPMLRTKDALQGVILRGEYR
ncbi:MAG: amylo-alpha-1,6-glucosidase [Massilia sp.]